MVIVLVSTYALVNGSIWWSSSTCEDISEFIKSAFWQTKWVFWKKVIFNSNKIDYNSMESLSHFIFAAYSNLHFFKSLSSGHYYKYKYFIWWSLFFIQNYFKVIVPKIRSLGNWAEILIFFFRRLPFFYWGVFKKRENGKVP